MCLVTGTVPLSCTVFLAHLRGPLDHDVGGFAPRMFCSGITCIDIYLVLYRLCSIFRSSYRVDQSRHYSLNNTF